MIAAVADVGMPSVSSGTSVPEKEALLAASGPATPSIAPLPNSSWCLLRRFSIAVGQEGRHLGAARGQRAEREADRRAAQPRLPRALGVGAAEPARRRGVLGVVELLGRLVGVEQLLVVALAQLGRHVQRLADGEQPDGDDHDVDAVAELVDAEREPRLAGELVDADAADEQAERQRRPAADDRAADERGDRREGQDREREVVLRAELDGQVGDRLRDAG